MGRKSREKKHRRESDKKPQQQMQSKKKTQTKQEGKARFKLRFNKKKIFGAALAVIMLTILVSVGYLLFQRAFRAQPIAKFLPADNTVAVLEINSNFDHNQLVKAFNLLKNHPQYSKAKLIERLEKYFGLNYENDIEPWLGRQVGAAILNSKKDPEHINLVYFAEVLSNTNLNKFLSNKNASKNVYLKHSTYMIDGPYYITVIGDYAFFSTIEQAIYELIDYQVNNVDKLYNAPEYRRVDSNLPINRTAFFYINFDGVKDGFFKFFPMLSERGLSSEALLPFLKVFDAEGMALIAMENNFAIQSFLSLNRDLLKNIQAFNYQEKYTAALANYINSDVILFWGAENLEAQLKRMLGILAGGEEGTLALFDGLINNYTQKYFGPDISFTYDILPLFKNEFAFVMEQKDGAINYKLLLELDKAQSDAIKIHEIANSFASVGAIFKPKVVEHTLEDGTVGKEIVAVPEEIKRNEVIYLDTTIYELQIGEQGWSIYYSVFGNIATITNNFDSIKNVIDLANNNKNSLRLTDLFNNHIEPVLNSSDELAYFNMKEFLPFVFGEQEVPEFLNITTSLSSGRNYFNDGIVTINYLNVQ